MRIRLEATSVRIGTEAVERTGIEKFTSTHRHFAFLPCLLGARAIGQPWLRHWCRVPNKDVKYVHSDVYDICISQMTAMHACAVYNDFCHASDR